MDKVKLQCIPPYSPDHRLFKWMHTIHEVQHMMGVQQHTHQTRGQVESSLSYTQGTLWTNSHVFQAYKLPHYLSDDDKYYIPQASCTRVAFCLHGWSSNTHKMTPWGNWRRTSTTPQRIHTHHSQYLRTAWPLSQTWEVCLWTKRNWLLGHDCRTGYIKNGSKENTRSCWLVLLENHIALSRPNQENHPMALGQTPVESFQDPKESDVLETCPSPTQLHKMLLPPNRCISLWHGHHTLTSGRCQWYTTCQNLETKTTSSCLLLCDVLPSRKELWHLWKRATGHDEVPCPLAPLSWMDQISIHHPDRPC